MTATKIQPGDDLHLTSLMTPHSLNFVTGADRAALLAYGRDVFAAARDSKCLAQIEEPAQPVAEICSASHDDAEFGERAIKPLCDISGFEYGTPLYAGAAPAAVTPQGEWRIDTSAGREILVYKNCSVIEEADARYVLSLIAAASQPAAVADPANDLAELAMLNKLIELGAKASYAHAKSNSDDGPAGTAAYVQWQELRAEMGELIRAHKAPALEAPAAPATSAQVQALHRARRALHAIGKTYDDSELRTRALEADEEIERMLAAAPQTPAQEAPAAPAVPPGFALVPLRLTRAMDEAISEEGWQWEDLLAAAQAVTEEQYEASAQDRLSQDEVREIFLECGFTIKQGQTDLKPYVYEAAQALEARVRTALAAAPQAPAAPSEGLESLLNEALAEMKRIAETEQVSLTPTFHNEVRRPNDKRKFHMGDARRAARNAVSALEKAFAVVIASNAAAPAAPAVDAFTHTELLEIQRAVEEFADCNETDVDYALLLRAAQAGYLECTQFHVLNQSALDLDTVAAGQIKEGGEAC